MVEFRVANGKLVELAFVSFPLSVDDESVLVHVSSLPFTSFRMFCNSESIFALSDFDFSDRFPRVTDKS